MSENPHRLPFREKFGYSLGDAATNFFFQSMIFYQNRFYTDTFGLSAVAVGTMFFVVRFWDAIFDPIVGALSDRTQSRWGKFRPWVLFTAAPFGLVFWLAYTTPHFGSAGKLVYAYITYLLLMSLYSANNTPYSALNGVMTGDVNERTSVSAYRFVAAMAATLLIQGLALPLVDKFGQGNSAHGWSMTIGIFAAVAVVFYVIAFASTKERVRPDPKQRSSLKRDLKDVFTCRPWVAMFLLTLFTFTTLALRGGSLNYYFTYLVDRQPLMAFLDKVGLGPSAAGVHTWWKSVLGAFGLIVRPDGSNASAVGFGFYGMAANVVTIIGVLCSKPLSERFGKKVVFTTGLALTAVVTAATYIVPPDGVGLLFFLSMLWPAVYGPTIPLLWAMIADVADYSEWKNGRRATGFVFAGIVFALKAGLGLGGALGGWVLAAYGYVANAPQSAHSLEGIRLSATVYSGIPFALGALCMLGYPITRDLNLRIGAELEERRKRFAPA
jgi:glycoside/pentoside/hexuronide:cation symporter, GPH family